MLTGVPGTGKSWWIWFAMHKLLNRDNPPAIVWQSFKRSANNCVLFVDGEAFSGPIDAFAKELEMKSTWCER